MQYGNKRFVVIKKEKGVRERESREGAEMYLRMNLEPMSRDAIEADYWDWRRCWREETPRERKQREYMRRVKKEGEQQREKQSSDWRVADRRKVYDYLQRCIDKEKEAERGNAMRAELDMIRKRNTEARLKALFVEQVQKDYEGCSF